MFKTNDKVEAFGLTGTVVRVNDGSHMYSVVVVWDNGGCDYFTLDGRLYTNHLRPSLLLVDRPKKKVKKKFYIAVSEYVDQGSTRYGHQTGYAYPHRRDCESMASAHTQIVEVELELDEE
jgi:hypothetical protein